MKMGSEPIRKRPTTVAGVRHCVAGLVTPESVRDGLAFRPLPTDVLIVSYPKCGMTWLQQIVHGLRTRGSMDFDEITAVVPWVELALDMGIDLAAPQPAEPRAFKSHLLWEEIPKGGRYICVIRDPKDVCVSTYYFYEGWRFEPGSISMPTFARQYFMRQEGRRRYWLHLPSWWRQRKRPDVLMLCFEDMKRDLPATVRKVARFIGCGLDEELLETVVRQSSIEFMSAHRGQFDDHLLRRARNAACGLPPGGSSSKVRAGRVGDHRRELPDDVARELDAIWQQEIGQELGLADYPELRAELAEEGAAGD
jgi:hypothetical protein